MNHYNFLMLRMQ